MNNTRIAILASGSGTNAENIINFFADKPGVDVVLVGANNKEAYVLTRAADQKVPGFTFTRTEMEAGLVAERLNEEQIDYVILAGFLLKIPDNLLQAFPDRIINIHPALLPSYGGKGMYGPHVHEAVIKNGDKYSGISIHLVNENYDEGRMLFQAMCPVDEKDTPETLAKKVHELEYRYFPSIIEDYIREHQGQVAKNS
jgi:phosphoribosylglycinamide formyltransferase-1